MNSVQIVSSILQATNNKLVSKAFQEKYRIGASISLCKRMITQLIEKASKVRSILRPNRTFGRYRNHTRRRYYNHMKPCV